MAYVSGVVYGPPSEGLPFLVVLLHEGQVVASSSLLKNPLATLGTW